ncbi:MAG: hypothetical protein JXA21_09460 [Anaerolineae bacterium]|nr:hypothetical protein [Anaerolineae bacterium]
MNEEFQQPTSDPSVMPGTNASPPAKSKKVLWVILALVVGVSCLASVICFATFGYGLVKTAREKAPVESVLDSYMQAMADKDIESAYALFSPRAQRQIPLSKLQELIEGNNYVVFEGYQSLSVQTLNIKAVANTNPDVPQGTVAEVTGIVAYDHDVQGKFTGTLEKVDDVWQLDAIYITVPPSKL